MQEEKKKKWKVIFSLKDESMLAIYEMLYVDDVPAKVALDEALQLAKEFSDDKSRRFINGVLSNLL